MASSSGHTPIPADHNEWMYWCDCGAHDHEEDENESEEIGVENIEGSSFTYTLRSSLEINIAPVPSPDHQSEGNLLVENDVLWSEEIEDYSRNINTVENNGRNTLFYDFMRSNFLMGEEPNFPIIYSNTFSIDQADYVSDDYFDEVLDNLADIGRKGAPPAAKSEISGLPTVKILTEADSADCTICQDKVGVGELMKKLPCGHGYHGDCIVKWLDSRNSCPVCRFELPTDDLEYEEMRKSKRRRTEEFAF